MKKILATLAVCMIASVSTFAQYTTNYYDQYGRSTGSSTTLFFYGGISTTSYHDRYVRNNESDRK